MDCCTSGLPVHHQLLEFTQTHVHWVSTQTHVHWVSDAIQPSQTLLAPSPPTFNLSQQQSLFKWVSSSHQVAKVLEFQLQHQSFQWISPSISWIMLWKCHHTLFLSFPFWIFQFISPPTTRKKGLNSLPLKKKKTFYWIAYCSKVKNQRKLGDEEEIKYRLKHSKLNLKA